MKAAVLAIALCLGLFVFAQENAYGQCRILTTQGTEATGNADALARLLSREAACPRDVFELRALLKRAGAELRLPLARGELFFGHFTALGPGQTLVLDETGLSSAGGSGVRTATCWVAPS